MAFAFPASRRCISLGSRSAHGRLGFGSRRFAARPSAGDPGVAIGLSLTRVVVLAHWASDVIAGFALGAVLERTLRLWTGYPAFQGRTAMPIVEDLKEYAERATGLRRPGKHAPELVRVRKPRTVRFKDDGLVPNHPRWPLIIYRGAVELDERHDPAAVIEDLFEANGWGDTWRDGIYDYVHYHAKIHEVLGVARGKGRVRFGGKKVGSSR